MADPRIKQARDAIGEQAGDDYIIAPINHAKELRTTAPSLADMLERDKFARLARLYKEQDADASLAQKRFVSIMTWANRMVLGAAIATAIVMAMAVKWPPNVPDAPRAWMVGFSGAAAVFGAVAAALQSLAVQGNFLGTWMRRRASVETARIAYFRALTDEALDKPDPVTAALLKLAYFRRYQLEVQLAYYRKRASELRQASNRNLLISAGAVFIGALVTAISTSAGLGDSPLLPLAALGTVGAGLSSYASAQDALQNNRRNAERYDRTYEALHQISLEIGNVEDAIVAQNFATLPTFVAAVHEQLSLEHRQFLELGDSQLSAMNKLKEELEAAAAKAAQN